MIKIDKGVKIPPKKHGGGTPAKYPFADLKIGDSFFMAAKPTQAHGRTTYWRKKFGHEYTVRQEKNGTRVWRIK